MLKLNRRELLKLTVAGLGLAVVGIPPERPTHELEYQRNSPIVFVDFPPPARAYDTKGRPELQTSKYYGPLSFMLRFGVPIDKIISGGMDLLRLLIRYRSIEEVFKDESAKLFLFQNHPEFSIVLGVWNKYREHGNMVTRTFRRVLELWDDALNGPITLLPLPEHQVVDGISVSTEGEIRISAHVNTNGLIMGIKEIAGKKTPRILSLSLLFGPVAFSVSDKGITPKYFFLGLQKNPDGTEIHFYAPKPVGNDGYVQEGYSNVVWRSGYGYYEVPYYFDILGNRVYLHEIRIEEIKGGDNLVPAQHFEYGEDGKPKVSSVRYYLNPGVQNIWKETVWRGPCEIVALDSEKIQKFMDDNMVLVPRDEIAIETHESYAGDDDQVISSLRQLFTVCRAFPNTIVCAAIGNNKSRVIDFENELKAEWPKNLVLCGEWDSSENRPEYDSYGSTNTTVYVPLEANQGARGSSNATPILAALCHHLKLDSRSPLEVIRRYCHEIVYNRNGQETKALVFNPF